jgi:hypothetical protein
LLADKTNYRHLQNVHQLTLRMILPCKSKVPFFLFLLPSPSFLHNARFFYLRYLLLPV